MRHGLCRCVIIIFGKVSNVMQQKLMSYQIFTEIFRSANRELNSMASELLVSPKQEAVGKGLAYPPNRPVENHQASA